MLDTPPPAPVVEFCVTNEAEQTIYGAWMDIAAHRRQGVQRRSVTSGASACGVLAGAEGKPPVLRLQREGGAGAACVVPAEARARRYVFSYHSNAEIGERCDLVAATPAGDR